MMWYTAEPSKLAPSSPEKKGLSSKAQVSKQMVSPYLQQRRAVQKPLPDVVSPLKREAVIRASPRKAQEFLSESLKKRESRYDAAGHPNGSLCNEFLIARSPKVKKNPAKKLSRKEHKSSNWGDEEMDRIMANVEARSRLRNSGNGSIIGTDSQPIIGVSRSSSTTLDIGHRHLSPFSPYMTQRAHSGHIISLISVKQN